jgi:hypothetical protein
VKGEIQFPAETKGGSSRRAQLKRTKRMHFAPRKKLYIYPLRCPMSNSTLKKREKKTTGAD